MLKTKKQDYSDQGFLTYINQVNYLGNHYAKCGFLQFNFYFEDRLLERYEEGTLDIALRVFLGMITTSGYVFKLNTNNTISIIDETSDFEIVNSRNNILLELFYKFVTYSYEFDK